MLIIIIENPGWVFLRPTTHGHDVENVRQKGKG